MKASQDARGKLSPQKGKTEMLQNVPLDKRGPCSSKEEGEKMAATTTQALSIMPPSSLDSLTAALPSLELRLLSKMEELDKPLVEQLGDIRASRERTRQLAESAIELARINQEDIKSLQALILL